MKPNPYLIVLGTVALLAIVVGIALSGSLVSAPVGIALLVLGGVAFVGWLVVSALVWEREQPR